MTSTGPVPSRRPLRAAVLRSQLLRPHGPVDRLTVVERAGSTNLDLAARVRADPACRTGVGVLVTEHQVEGRGRSGRLWHTPPAAALTFSLSLRPAAPPEEWGWAPLLVGLGVARAVRDTTGVGVVVKWPNDLLVDAPGAAPLAGWGTERKVGGILVELVTTPSGPLLVAGVGLNVSQSADELPVPTAQSLTGAGAPDPDRDALLVACVRTVVRLVERWDATDGDVDAAGLAGEVAAACATVGRRVRVELPGDARLDGVAAGLGPDGALLVRDAAGRVTAVRAGDVRHVRMGENPPDGRAGADPGVTPPAGAGIA